MSPRTVITGETVSGGGDDSLLILSAKTTPAMINSCSIIDSSNNSEALSVGIGATGESSPSSSPSSSNILII